MSKNSMLESKPQSFPVRFVTATSLFDGHDASINIMRRILQSLGAEVVHLGHDRGVEEVVRVAIQEDAHAIAISSYQGGHNEYFKYMIDLLKEQGASHIKVFGGGGGVIIEQEIRELMSYGVTRIYSPEDGRTMGLEGMISDMVQKASQPLFEESFTPSAKTISLEQPQTISRTISWIESVAETDSIEKIESFLKDFSSKTLNPPSPILGITGTGGAGKSCLTDEVVRRFVDEFPNKHVAVVSVDPSKRKTGGALLGDRLRMNNANHPRVFMRSMATRRSHLATSNALHQTAKLLSRCGFDLVILETAGIGQSDSEITDMVDTSVYVMTPEFGAPTQLEKIDMIDFADCIVINKFDKPGAEDALSSVQKQYKRSRKLFDAKNETLPVFGVVASRFNDDGTNWFYKSLVDEIISKKDLPWNRTFDTSYAVSKIRGLIPQEHRDYLRRISSTVLDYKKTVRKHAATARQAYQLHGAAEILIHEGPNSNTSTLKQLAEEKTKNLPLSLTEQIQSFEKKCQQYREEKFHFQVRDKTFEIENFTQSLSGTSIAKVSTPKYKDWGDITEWLGFENFPGSFPFTAGVFPFKREGEDPTRMFAGEGIAERTNRRFHFLSKDGPAARLSTAFDSVTLYGSDPGKRLDIFGKVGNAGVSVATVDDAKRLYSGFDLLSPSTSVSMTINGPAPMLLAFFMNAAIDQQVEKHLAEQGNLEAAEQKIKFIYQSRNHEPPVYRGELPENHNGLGLATLGISGDELVDSETYGNIKAKTLSQVRGTVQADILKEDQAQNTCIFSTTFALKMMGDIQAYFSKHKVKNFYSVSISGYHIAEAGANPITQVAFTLANGFTLIEYYLARGLSIDDFAPNLSFFFSNGMDPEYAVIGRAARRIFAVALRDRYSANERSQKLKYHIQTSGRSLHAQEIDFNDIRTTLQALYAIYDNCNSLHTNAYDEAITTPTEESVRRALAIQMIINREFGQAQNQNNLQGSFYVEELTHLVEEAILSEFVRISDRGGVLGAMETMYQRNKIQEESMHYETLKQSGELPIVGVNTFINPKPVEIGKGMELARSTDDEKTQQIQELKKFHDFHSPKHDQSISLLKEATLKGGNIFEALLETVKHSSLGQISNELFHLGGQYRRHI